MDNLEPYDLGIPKEVKAFIRPVSELKKRTLDLTTTKAPSSYSSVCRCERMESCPAEKRDYITFRKSCPFGQVQCCRSFGNREEFDNLSKISGPAQVSQIRPVHIPVSLVPTTPLSSTSTASIARTEPISTPTSTPEGPTEPQTTPSVTISPTPASTTPPPVTLF